MLRKKFRMVVVAVCSIFLLNNVHYVHALGKLGFRRLLSRYLFRVKMKSLILLILLSFSIISCSKKNNIDVVQELINAPVSSIDAEKLAPIFEFFSDFTDLQREKVEEDLTGQVVVWDLEVYEVQSTADPKIFEIQTSSGNARSDSLLGSTIQDLGDSINSGLGKRSNHNVGTTIILHINHESEKSRIYSLKTGSWIKVKGRISGISSLRYIKLNPAIFYDPTSQENNNPSSTSSDEYPHIKPFLQDCRGVLKITDEYGLFLKNYPSNDKWDSWCDAELDGMKEKVLKICSLNNKCEIKGNVEGHGAFEWVYIDQISQVDSLTKQPNSTSQNLNRSTISGEDIELVRSFYLALSNGNGELANSFLIPEKRNVGNFQQEKIKFFYSNMKHRLQINDILPIDENTVKVKFEYTVDQKKCKGLSTVTLRRIDENNPYIEKIISNC